MVCSTRRTIVWKDAEDVLAVEYGVSLVVHSAGDKEERESRVQTEVVDGV